MRIAIRRLLASPALSATAVLSLALGLGANATLFSWVRGALVDPLPPAINKQGLYVLAATGPGEITGSLALTELEAIKRGVPALSAVAATFPTEMHLATDGGQPPERLMGALVSGDYFQALGVAIARGRAFLPHEDAAPRAHPVAVISHDLWRTRFGGNPSIAGSSVTINGDRYTVVGVAPERFWGTAVGVDTAIWVPLAMHEAFILQDLREAREIRVLSCVARLAPGATETRARDELAAQGAQLASTGPAGTRRRSFTILPFWRAPSGAQAVLRPMLLPMAGLSALLLLLACINVAQAQLARAQARERTAAVQLAVGATPARLARETLADAALLSGLATVCALIVAWWSAQLLVRIVPAADFTPRFNVAIDPWVVGFATLLAGVAATLVAALSARWASRTDIVLALRQEAGTLMGSRRSIRMAAVLVVAQVSLAVAILTGAGLLLRSLHRYQTGDPGFDPRDVLVGRYNLLRSQYPPEAGAEFHRQLLERLKAAPRVAGATLARWIPLGLSGAATTTIEVPDYVPPSGEELRVRLNIVGPSYFTTLRIPIIRGRDFDARDTATGRRVAAVSQAAAERFWPGRDPVGATLVFAGSRYEVVAVAGNVPLERIMDVPEPCVYIPLAQAYRADMILHVRVVEGEAAPLDLVRETIAALDSDLPLTEPRMLSEYVSDAGFRQRVGATLFGLFGALAALLGGLGIYGLLAHFVVERTRELALRMALGAEPARLRRLVLGRSLMLAAAGILPGLALGLWASRFLAALLIGVRPVDPITLVAVPAFVLLTAVAGALAPLARLRKVDPAALLRG